VQIETTDPDQLEQDFERVRELHLDGGQFVLLQGGGGCETAPFSNASIDDTFISVNASISDTLSQKCARRRGSGEVNR
jgi:NAD(P)H-flavin reductase